MREYTPTSFVRHGDGLSPLVLRSAEGSEFQLHVLDHSLLRVRHIPAPLRPGHAQLPQLTTHSVAPDDPRHLYHADPPKSPTSPTRPHLSLVDATAPAPPGPSNETPEMHVSGLNRDEVHKRFPCPPPDVTSKPDGHVLVTDTLRVEVTLDGGSGCPVLSWSSQAAPDRPFLVDLPHRSYSLFKNSLGARHFARLRDSDLHYGLGERASPLTLNGRRFRLETLDAMGYDPQSTDPLYKHLPFLITLDTVTRQAHGVFYDTLAQGSVDLGNEIDAFWGPYRHFTTEGGCGLDMYVVFGPSVEKVVEGFTRIVGHPALPPKYALGYLASSMGYAESEEAQTMIEKLPSLCREWDIPCDLLHLSSGYTVEAKTGARNVFTWNKTRFPEPEKLIKGLRDNGIRVAANIKPWLLSQHPDYEKLKSEKGYVWDPETNAASSTRLWSAGGGATATGSYIDLSSPAGRSYWKRGVRSLLELGIEGIWNDNNEFALPDDDHLYASSNLSSTSSTVGSAGRALQTMLMATASHEAMIEHDPTRRPFLITRSGTPGIQRYASQTWSGDNYSSWQTLKHNVPMGLGAGLSGLSGYGHDVGGFVGPRPEKELFVRWVQNGVFHPRFCIHSWKQEGVTEPWMYPDVMPIIREAIHLRYKLLPYLYNLSHEAARTGHPVIRPLVYHFPLDPAVQSASFEFMLGRHLLVASVLEKGAVERTVKLPLGDPWCDVWTGKWHNGGLTVRLAVPLKRCGGLLASAGALIPTGPVMNYVGQPGADKERLVWCFPAPTGPPGFKRRSEMLLIEDDGETKDAPTTEIKCWMEAGENEITVGVQAIKRGYKVLFDRVWFVLPHGDRRTLKGAGDGVKTRVGQDKRTEVGVPFTL
ncbi:hypothetical protein HK101_000243 [Irineochytrium annulatum]|nr:hypothetical protein HK101_000243 [Irineochytrium annulatum]